MKFDEINEFYDRNMGLNSKDTKKVNKSDKFVLQVYLMVHWLLRLTRYHIRTQIY